jgi:hypothetical protein
MLDDSFGVLVVLLSVDGYRRDGDCFGREGRSGSSISREGIEWT